VKKLYVIAILIIALLVGVAVGTTLQDILRIPTSGDLDLTYGLTANPTSIYWGNITLNTPITKQLNLTNTGTKPIANLTASYGNETSNLVDYTLAWDAEDFALPIGASILANFTLTILDATGDRFSFDIYIADKG
jgi:hypothetical protein